MHPIWQVSIIQSPIPYFPVKTMVKQQKSADFLTNEIGCHPYNAAVEVFASLYDSSLMVALNEYGKHIHRSYSECFLVFRF